jgi:hypothetical protein
MNDEETHTDRTYLKRARFVVAAKKGIVLRMLLWKVGMAV